MGLVISSTRADFQSPNGLTAQTVIVSGGLPPYSAASSDTDVCSVAQATSPNVYGNSDTLSDSTLTGLTKASGGPNGATDAELTGTNSPIGSNAVLDRLCSVVMGQTYTYSDWFDPSQITNNNGNGVNMLGNADFSASGSVFHWNPGYDSGSLPYGWTDYNNGNQVSPAETCTFAADSGAGAPFGTAWKLTFTANKTTKGLRCGGGWGDTSLGSFVLKAGKQYVFSFYAKASVASMASFGLSKDNNNIQLAWCSGYTQSYNDTNWHRYAILITPTADYADGLYPYATNDPGGVSQSVWFAGMQLEEGTAPSAWSNSNQVVVGINTADNLTQILQQYVAINTTTAGRYATSAWTCPTNLAPHSDDLSTWAINGGGTLGTGGPGGATDYEVTGTGSPLAYPHLDSTAIDVVPGQTYAFSLWCDPSQITASAASAGIWDTSVNTQYEYVSLPNGAAGRYATPPWTCPNGVTQVKVIFDGGGATVSSGQKLKFSQPMLEPASTAAGYYISSQNPQVHVYAELLSSAIVASGGKFKISQPALRNDGGTAYVADNTVTFTVKPKKRGVAAVTVTDSTP